MPGHPRVPRIAGATGATQPAPTFFGSAQEHKHSETYLVDQTTGAANIPGLFAHDLTQSTITNAAWEAHWDSTEIVNGDFEHEGNSWEADPIPSPHLDPDYNVFPGWSPHHGGGGDADVDSADGNHFLVLTAGDGKATRTHNPLYVPANVAVLTFDPSRVVVSDDDLLEVRLGDTVLQSLPLSETDPDGLDSPRRRVVIPGKLRDQVNTLTFSIQGGTDGVDATGLFNASSADTSHSSADVFSSDGLAFANAVNAPRWADLADYQPISAGDYEIASGADAYGTDWLIETLRGGANVAKQSGVTFPIRVNRISSQNGPTRPYPADAPPASMRPAWTSIWRFRWWPDRQAPASRCRRSSNRWST